MHALLAVFLFTANADPASADPAEHPAVERPYWDRCTPILRHEPYVVVPYGSVYVPGPLPEPHAPASPPPLSGGHPSGVSGGGGGGGNLGMAVLVIAVVAIAVLPIIVYAVDDDADPLTRDRFYCPEFSLSMGGGFQAPVNGQSPALGIGQARFRATVGYIGVDASFDVAPQVEGVGAFSTHFLIRPLSKKHIEGALALGVRSRAGPGGMLDGLEVALPHEYVFWRSEYRSLGLELVPRVFLNRRAVDVGAETSLLIPIGDILQLRVGGTAFSHAGQVQLGASAGLSAIF